MSRLDKTSPQIESQETLLLSHPSPSIRHFYWLVLLCAGFVCLNLHAQSSSPLGRVYGSVSGSVTDSSGNVIPGARVTLLPAGSKTPRSVTTDGAGAFSFSDVGPGTYRLSIASKGFASATEPVIAIEAGQRLEMSPLALQVATASTSVRVTFTSVEIAEQQMHVEEKQRVLGIVPNFYVSYVWDAQPLTSGQKYRLALRTSVDPVTILGSGFIAGIQQWQNNFKEYGQGSEGYAKRFGANYTDGLVGVMLGGAIFPALLHQDPRYFYKGTGSIRSRTLYAISTIAICKGDNGRWQPNYSNLLGTFGAAGISNLYYPSNDRGFQLTMENSLLGLAGNAAGALFQEFLIRKISRGVPASHTP
jgi:hypothetical protein